MQALTKYALMAVLLHAAILVVPVSNQAQDPGVRVIDVLVMKQEVVPTLTHPLDKPPVVAKLRLPQEFVPEVKDEPRTEVANFRNKREESQNELSRAETAAVSLKDKKEEPAPAGSGNVLDERIITQLASGSGPGNRGGVAVSGLAVPGGTVGMGSGSTGGGHGSAGSASGNIGASGTGTEAGGGPVDAIFGQPDGPQFVYRSMPEYPFVAKRLRKEGRVILRIIIDEKGGLQKVDVVESSDQMFALAAVEALRRSTFQPAKRKGVAVISRATLPIRFALRD